MPGGTQAESTCRRRDAPIVAAEEREKILGEIVLVALVERADDAEIDGDVLRPRGSVTSTKMLPGCMSAWKKLWRNTCVKKISTPFSASRLMSVPAARSASMSSTWMPKMRSIVSTFVPAVVPVDLRHVEQVGPREIALELRRVGRFAHQVELDGERPLELRDDFDGVQPARIGPVPLG